MKKKSILDELNSMLSQAKKDIHQRLLIGRPEREHIISEDDILNLQIAMNSAKDLDDFLEKV